MSNHPWHAWLLLLSPGTIGRRLADLRASGRFPAVPNLWQVELGVLRMWHRTIFRSETIGTCKDFQVRRTWRARLFQFRPLRFPGLIWERAVVPWDLSGLLSPPEQVIRHLLGAHHDRTQFIYDLQMLEPAHLADLLAQTRQIIQRDDRRSRWLRDLTVYERYHESLLEGLERYLAGERELDPADATDPDISFRAYLAWCARQPSSPAATRTAWRAGLFDLQRGLISTEGVA